MSVRVKLSEDMLQDDEGVQVPVTALDAEAFLSTVDTTANTLGTVVGSVEVLAPDGTSLGFLPLYDAITTV